MKYKLLLFDFDGTLADSLPWFLGIINQVADRYAFKRIAEHELETLRGYDARRLMKHLGLSFWKLPFVANHMRRAMARDIRRIPLFEGVGGLLQRLSARGTTLAVVTSNSYQNVRQALGPESAALIQYYECGSSLFGKSARLKRVLAKSGVLPGQALCIGDELRDLEAARSAGIPFGAVSWGFTRVEALRAQAPAEVFTTLDEILEKTA
jgi:phosphoglycolate phosphatase